MGKSHSDSAFEVVPMDLRTLLDPAWLSWALDDISEGDRIVAVEEADTSKTLAQKTRFSVTVEGADGTLRTRPYCVKAHFHEEGPGSLAPEARFYRDLAPAVGIRTPRAYYAGVDDAERGLIVMDDVIGNGGRFLSAREPYTVATAMDSLGQLAQLHAATWGTPTPAGCEWIVPRVTSIARMFTADHLQRLLDDGRCAGVDHEYQEGGSLLAAIAATGELAPTCVLHGDTHSGNVYLDAEGRACWLDWQVVQSGHWSTDVSYHLGTVLSVDDRRTHEVELLQHYLAELDRLGAKAPSWDDAWNRYASGFAFGYFFWVITTVSSREVVMLHMPRLATAMSDHDTYGRLGVTPK
jgi:hypothetical protein